MKKAKTMTARDVILMMGRSAALRGSGERRFETWFVSPEAAAEFLREAPHKRTIRASHVASLVAENESGRWVASGETIRIGWDGALLNGHHRMMMIDAAKKGVELDFAIGVDPATKAIQDTIAAVRASDWTERKNARNGSAVCNLLIRWAANNGTASRREIAIVWDYLGDRSIQFACGGHNSHRIASHSATRLALALAHTIDESKAEGARNRLVSMSAVDGSSEASWMRAYANGRLKIRTEATPIAARFAMSIVTGEMVGKLYPADKAKAVAFFGLEPMLEELRK